jgi:hypothetical protein
MTLQQIANEAKNHNLTAKIEGNEVHVSGDNFALQNFKYKIIEGGFAMYKGSYPLWECGDAYLSPIAIKLATK